ncbi:hypothetical protein A1O3_07128 [Capronia epimyces CBS 606.96]|uniref:HAUS augmin-like complex subunit 6 N-terminal domain-containing protein n=1 Tax=Capronia epimyces CBS 606.96 TaxID=1182542 RepID=W9XK38_9EURO|nr:uncharacterized protein A1O3_07128 [Capronia epimyces CBS 606.96]EXJ80842.1 hypothetical protein A1O3_07128 [Capronia epimyces CBS 606.96]
MDRSSPTTGAPKPAHQIQWRPRSDVAVFVRTLHLLDLDLLPDFPGIAESTFARTTSTSASMSRSAASQPQTPQSRIKAVEWSFYRLFQIYDAEGTRAKLASHFPPAAPIQSLNLRAGIYKWLTELKKDGILPRETVLRKTMLDECKGEKFEELLAAFAMLVLRASLARNADQSVKGRERWTGAVKTCRTPDGEDVVPLILAHRFLLQQSLRKRQDLREKATVHAHDLKRLQSDITTRLQLASQPGDVEELSAEEYEVLKDQVNHAFAADRQWAAYILQGNPASTTLSAATQEALDWTSGESAPSMSGVEDRFQDTLDSSQAEQAMKRLRQSTLDHQAQVQRLERLRTSLLATTQSQPRPTPSPTSTLPPAPVGARPTESRDQKKTSAGSRFNKHQTLTVTSLMG